MYVPLCESVVGDRSTMKAFLRNGDKYAMLNAVIVDPIDPTTLLRSGLYIHNAASMYNFQGEDQGTDEHNDEA